VEQNVWAGLRGQGVSGGAIAPGMHLPVTRSPATHAAAVAEATRPSGQWAGQQTDPFCERAIAPHPDYIHPATLPSAIAPSVAADG
ncbi:hypothetical protein, partial [Thermoleptolyngbya sp.]